MSENGGCKDCGGGEPRRSISRANFLKGGAATAAAASVGCAGFAFGAAPPAVPRRRSCPKNCPPTDMKWAIPAGVLNAFFNDCYPRLLAKWWLDAASVPSLNMPAMSMKPDDANMDAFLDQLGIDISTLTGSARFASRQTLVTTYLGGDPKWRIPIRFIKNGGFDYILSDWGMELFSPVKPETLNELLVYYTYRRTGNAAIGIPHYMVDAPATIDLSGPTGPSQPWIDPTVIEHLIDTALREGIIDELCSNAAKQYLADSEVFVSPAERLHGPVWRDGAGIARYGVAREGERGHPLDRLEYATSADAVKCVLEPTRCWQVTGAVLRGLLVELPRVVATVWLENSLAADGQDRSYSRRITANVAGLREIFLERLETSLPGVGDMTFAWQSTFGAGAGPAAWNANDIMVSNTGVYLPDIPGEALDPPPGVTAANPNVKDKLAYILSEIANGTAGNPVFTDSVRSE